MCLSICLHICTYVHNVCVVPVEARKECLIPWSWSTGSCEPPVTPVLREPVPSGLSGHLQLYAQTHTAAHTQIPN